MQRYLRFVEVDNNTVGSGQDYLNAFRSYAGQLVAQYSEALHEKDPISDSSRRLHILEKAMYKLESELNGRLADIFADAEELSSLNEKWLEKGLIEISSSSIKELLNRNFRG